MNKLNLSTVLSRSLLIASSLTLVLGLASQGFAAEDSAAKPAETRPGPAKVNDPGKSKLGGYSEVTEAGKVPDHLYNIVLGKPTNEQITASVLSYEDMTAVISYGRNANDYNYVTDSIEIAAAIPVDFTLEDAYLHTFYKV